MSDTENDENQTTPQGKPTIPGESQDASSLDPNSIEGLFLAALQKDSPAQRDAHLDEICGDDDERRRRVAALLRAYEDAGSFLDTPVGGPRTPNELSLSFLKTTEKEGCIGALGHYEILEVIGRGGMGVVLKAVDPKLNRVVAVKVLLPELAVNPNARRRFLREAQAAAAVSHPHVVTIHAVEAVVDGDTPTPPYLVMECVVGQSLQERLDAVGPLRLEETLRISRQIAEGLAAAHKQGLIHRDIKPANILLENGVQRVKITDFGLARATDDLTVTRTGEVSGTPQYMSPEQASGQRVDHRSDLFSLGCVMYAMCTGHSPFRADSLAHVIKRVTQDTPRPIASQNPEVPAWLAQIIDCLLEKDAEQRFQSAEGLVAILDQHLARIQQPTDSGSHSMINQELPAAAMARPALPKVDLAATVASRTAESAPQPATIRQFLTLLLLCGLVGATSSIFLIPNSFIDASPNDAAHTLMRYFLFMSAVQVSQLLIYKVAYGSERPLKSWLLLSTASYGAIVLGFAFAAIVRMRPIPEMLAEIATLLGCVWIAFCIFVGKECFWGKRLADTNPSAQDLESIHGKVGRYLLTAGCFLLVVPFALIGVGPLIGSGDIMQFGGQCLVVALPLAIGGLVLGYVLRFIVDKQQSLHRPLNLRMPVIFALGAAVFAAAIHVVWERDLMRSKPASAGQQVKIASRPTIMLKHPAWDVRKLGFQRTGVAVSKGSPTSTRLTLYPKGLGTNDKLYVILKDGREYHRGIAVAEVTEIEITGDDLTFMNRALVELVNDIPDEIELQNVVFTTQAVTGENGFAAKEAPFHKLLEKGEHRIVITYERKDWKIEEGHKQYAHLDFRVVVRDDQPVKLSLKDILEENKSKERVFKTRYAPPDFKPLEQLD